MKKRKDPNKPPSDFNIALAAIRTEYPKCDPAALSYAHRTKHTGVMLCPRAAALEREALKRPERPGKDTRRCPCKLQARVTPERHAQVQQLLRDGGRFASVNEWLCWWISVWIRQEEKAQTKKKAAEAAATALNGTEKISTSNIDGK